MANDIIRITKKGSLLALIVKSGFKQGGFKFLVPDEYSQQIACISRPKGHVINSHIHKPVLRKIKFAQEALFIRNGSVRIDFYDEKKHYVESRIVGRGDVVFLAFGGHGFKIMKDAQIIEVKQGPFLKNVQPERFESVAEHKIKLNR